MATIKSVLQDFPELSHVKKFGNNTYKGINERTNETWHVLHRTAIVAYNAEKRQVVLNTGGWESVTTKDRMNDILATYGLPYYIQQKNFVWYVVNKDGGIEQYGNNPSNYREHIIQL